MRLFDALRWQEFCARGIRHEVADRTDLTPRVERGEVALWRSPPGVVIIIFPGRAHRRAKYIYFLQINGPSGSKNGSCTMVSKIIHPIKREETVLRSTIRNDMLNLISYHA
jgi:hypothetical protein